MDDPDGGPDHEYAHADGRDYLSSLTINHDDILAFEGCSLASDKSTHYDTSAGERVPEFIPYGPCFLKQRSARPALLISRVNSRRTGESGTLLGEQGATANELGDSPTRGSIAEYALAGGKHAFRAHGFVVMVDDEAAQTVAPVGVDLLIVGLDVRVVHTVIWQQQEANLNAAA